MKFSGKVWSDHELIQFWVNSGKRVGGSKVKLFVITGHSSESVAFARGGVCCAPHHSLVILFFAE